MLEEIDAIEAASRAIKRITRNGRFAEFELENGIVLHLKTVPPLLLTAVQAEFKYPEPPNVMIEEKGRNEPNPNDPGYIKECEEVDLARNLAINDVVLAVGTAFKSAPEGYFGPDEQDWESPVMFASGVAGKTLDIEPKEGDRTKRYLQWLRFYALETNIDVALATSLPYQLAGIREGEVEEVIESFQRNAQWGSDNGGEAPTSGSNRNQPNRAARRTRK